MKRLFLVLLAIFILAGCSKPQTTGEIVSEQTVEPSSAPLVTPSPSPPLVTPSPSPTLPPDDLTAQNGEYTIAWISDTQYYSRSFPEIYYEMTDFLVNEKDRLNLKYIVHTGDLVHNADVAEQWDVAIKAQSTIENIPNGVLAGNHDVFHEDADYSVFYEHFGAEKYSMKPYYAETFENNRGHADVIDIGDTQYLFVYMGYIQTEESLKWLDGVFKKYPERYGVLVLHDYITNEGTYSQDGQKIFDEVVSKNPNVKMVLCGHRYVFANISTKLDDDGDGNADRTVYEILGNYQAAGDMGGSGFMRFLKVNENEGKIYMYSYSPYLDEYVYYDEPQRMEEKYSTPAELETAVFDFKK